MRRRPAGKSPESGASALAGACRRLGLQAPTVLLLSVDDQLRLISARSLLEDGWQSLEDDTGTTLDELLAGAPARSLLLDWAADACAGQVVDQELTSEVRGQPCRERWQLAPLSESDGVGGGCLIIGEALTGARPHDDGPGASGCEPCERVANAEDLALDAERAREEAQANADRLRIALHAARAGVIDLDLEARTAWASPGVAEIIGRPVTFDDFAVRPWAMCHPDDRGRLDEVVATWTSGRHEPLDLRIVLPSGERRWIQIHGEKQPGAQGRFAKIIALVLDIDARKRQELALIEAERTAQAAIEAKDQFLANMSHEIRTPMNGVLGVLHLLADEALSGTGRRLLAEATSCGRLLSQLLNDVIDFSKIEAGRLELSPEPLDAADALASVVGLLRPQAEAKGLRIETQIDGGDAWVLVDPVRLNQALFNLVGNAVKFTSQGRVDARLAITSEAGGHKRLRFEVEDTGIGIPKAARETLFSRFQQADGSIGRSFGGSGLGLAITRTLAQMMGGEVGFVSAEGEGSTFWFDILAPAVARAESTVDAGQEAPFEGLNILVVEDNPTNQIIAVRILEGLGASVDTADDGLDGLRAIQARHYDLVLMDIQMPRMSGVEATRRVRALESPASKVPIIALTANALTHQRGEYIAAGMNGLVAKPMSPASLVSEVMRVVVGEDAVAAA